jgi:hypothetical protein
MKDDEIVTALFRNDRAVAIVNGPQEQAFLNAHLNSEDHSS